MKKVLTVSLLALAISACATTNTSSSNKPGTEDIKIVEKNEITKTTVVEKNKKKYVCKVTKKTGTNFKKRQCWEKEEYAEMQKRHQEEIQRFQRSNMGTRR